MSPSTIISSTFTMRNDSSTTAISSVVSSTCNRPLRVAIIGSGLSGLTAAYQLAKSQSLVRNGGVEVHLFERSSKIGLDSDSIDVVTEPRGKTSDANSASSSSVDGKKTRIDVPMRSVNAGYYPNVIRLYRELSVPLKDMNFTYSFATSAGSEGLKEEWEGLGSKRSFVAVTAPSPWFLYEGSSGIKGFALPSSLRRRQLHRHHGGAKSACSEANPGSMPTRRPAFLADTAERLELMRIHLTLVATFVVGYLYLLGVSLYHHYLGHTRDPHHPIATQTLQSYFLGAEDENKRRLQASYLMRDFMSLLVVPLFSAMMTVQASSVLHVPVAEIMDYVALTFARSHFIVATGVLEVERRISEPLDPRNIHVRCLVKGLKRRAVEGSVGSSISVEVEEDGRHQVYDDFDHVILATQASQSASFVQSMLEGGTKSISQAQRRNLEEIVKQLRRFTYEDSLVINHTDRRLLPARRSDWRDLNLVSPAGSSGSHSVQTPLSLVSSPPFGEARLINGESLAPRGTTQSADTHTMASHQLHSRPMFRATGPSGTNVDDADVEEVPFVLIQTTNPLSHLHPRPETVLSVSNFERAVLTLESKEAQRGLFEWRRMYRGSVHELVASLASSLTGRDIASVYDWQLCTGFLQGSAGIWVCGSWSPGIPLLEGCVTSASLIVAELERTTEGKGLPLRRSSRPSAG